MQSQVTIKEKALYLNSNFIEKVDDKTGKKQYFIEAFIVPFDEISRNGVMYNKESIKQTHQDLVGRPVMYNHVISGVEAISRGEWVETWVDDKGMHGKARIYNTNYNNDLIEYLSEASNPAVSLQINGRAESRKEESTGKYYQEAYIDDWLECSVIGGVQGFKNALVKNFEVAICEMLHKKEDNDMSNSGSFTTTKMKEDELEFKIGDEVETKDGKGIITTITGNQVEVELQPNIKQTFPAAEVTKIESVKKESHLNVGDEVDLAGVKVKIIKKLDKGYEVKEIEGEEPVEEQPEEPVMEGFFEKLSEVRGKLKYI